MNNLPQELVDEICSYMPREDLKHVLMLNRQFRYGAERCSGFFDEYTIKEDIFKPMLPPVLKSPDSEELPCRESAEEIREKDEPFTRQVQHLFNVQHLSDTLSLLEQQAGASSQRYIQLKPGHFIE
ncbi:hypothetical protein COCCADRAFT_4650 [Bipolaris zeicola 26-R-13]|uniref:F-box domain-containing protein n=1 Tax=Cochliobolus carbonum (strain 26-R-13) TaxID=930089 RepID=W6Y8V0_COCC2|nr:uncharacterized protein COCCADRAFT_4650 [Bipolaris zeicola 26-R-13]EUC33925.1 hypothetical protein COCCADRAFT_4650 [Bipolaris zeicola 26-R-13]